MCSSSSLPNTEFFYTELTLGTPLVVIIGGSCLFSFGTALFLFIVVSSYLESRRTRPGTSTTEWPDPEGNPDSNGVDIAMVELQSRSSTDTGSGSGEPSSPIVDSSTSSVDITTGGLSDGASSDLADIALSGLDSNGRVILNFVSSTFDFSDSFDIGEVVTSTVTTGFLDSSGDPTGQLAFLTFLAIRSSLNKYICKLLNKKRLINPSINLQCSIRSSANAPCSLEKDKRPFTSRLNSDRLNINKKTDNPFAFDNFLYHNKKIFSLALISCFIFAFWLALGFALGFACWFAYVAYGFDLDLTYLFSVAFALFKHITSVLKKGLIFGMIFKNLYAGTLPLDPSISNENSLIEYIVSLLLKKDDENEETQDSASGSGYTADTEDEESWATYSDYDDPYYTFEEFYADNMDLFDGDIDAAYISYFNCDINYDDFESNSEVYSEDGSVQSLSEVNDKTEPEKAESSNSNSQNNQESKTINSKEKTEDCNQESSKDKGKGKAKEK